MVELLSREEVSTRRKRGLALQTEGDDRNIPGAAFAVLATFSMDLFPPFLVEALERVGLHGEVHLGTFGQIAQEVLNPNSHLYSAAPQHVVVVPAAEDMLAPLFARPGSLSPSDAAALVQARLQELTSALTTLLARLPQTTCYVVVFGPQHAPLEHVLDPRLPERGQAIVEQFLTGIRELGGLSPRVVVVDWDWHTRPIGTLAYSDPRLWYLARMRLNPVGLATLADLVAGHSAAYRGMARKVVALDLDNTLWGGIIGEAGLKGLVLGEEGLGLAFQDFQRELLKLYDMGIVLALCSKNNPDDAFEVFDRHPGMILKREHFAAVRVNWQDKATNLQELAEDLNLGIDSFVFLDDNPVEREWVKRALPSVLVPDLPEDPVEYAEFLRRAPFFRRTTITEADRLRAQSYKTQGLRTQLKLQTASFEDFIASLEQEVSIEPVHEGSVARAAQMCQRTNQFNLTTRRYTAADIETMLQDNGVEVYTLSVKDRFGDNGITGLGILRFDGDTAEVDSLLLSCRILGRRVEDAFLWALVERARTRGASYLIGRYTRTPKNEQVSSFYATRGFEPAGEDVHRLDLMKHKLEMPPQVVVKVVAHA